VESRIYLYDLWEVKKYDLCELWDVKIMIYVILEILWDDMTYFII